MSRKKWQKAPESQFAWKPGIVYWMKQSLFYSFCCAAIKKVIHHLPCFSSSSNFPEDREPSINTGSRKKLLLWALFLNHCIPTTSSFLYLLKFCMYLIPHICLEMRAAELDFCMKWQFSSLCNHMELHEFNRCWTGTCWMEQI